MKPIKLRCASLAFVGMSVLGASAFAAQPTIVPGASTGPNAALMATPPPSTQIILEGFLCSSNATLQGSFDLRACSGASPNSNPPLGLTQYSEQNLAEKVSNMIYYYYQGVELQPSYNTFGPSGNSVGPTGDFCVTQDPSKPLGTKVAVPTPICNAGNVHATEYDTNSVNGAACGTPVRPTSVAPGLCDFSALTNMAGIAANGIDITQLCPYETTWLRSLRPQALESAYEYVKSEVDAGTINLTTLSNPGGTPSTTVPCQYFADSLNRLVFGVAVPASSGPSAVPITGVNQLRFNVQSYNSSQSLTTLQFNDHLTCSGAAVGASGLTGTQQVNLATTNSTGSCEVINAQHYLEFLFSQLLICEVNTIAGYNYQVALQQSGGEFNAIASSFSACEDYAQGVATPPLPDGSSAFWSNGSAQAALYGCYKSGSAPSGSGNNPTSGPPAPGAPAGGVYSAIQTWVQAQQGAGYLGNGLHVTTGLTTGSGANVYVPLPGPSGGAPEAASNYSVCLFFLPAVFRRRKRKARKRARVARFAVASLISFGLLFSATAFGATGNGQFCISVGQCATGGSGSSACANSACVCNAKHDACYAQSNYNYTACMNAAQASYNSAMSALQTQYTNDMATYGADAANTAHGGSHGQPCGWNLQSLNLSGCQASAHCQDQRDCCQGFGCTVPGAGDDLSCCSGGNCKMSHALRYAAEYCLIHTVDDPSTGTIAQQNQANLTAAQNTCATTQTAQLAACDANYGNSNCNQSIVLGPDCDPTTFSTDMSNLCTSGPAGQAGAGCQPPGTQGLPPPITAGSLNPVNGGEQNMLDAANSLNFGTNQLARANQANTSGGADTAGYLPTSPAGSGNTSGGAMGTAQTVTRPTAQTTSSGSAPTTNASSGGFAFNDTPPADIASQGPSSGAAAANTASADDTAAFADNNGGAGGGGGGANRRTAGTGQVGVDGAGTSDFNLSALGLASANNANGSPGPNGDDQIDPQEPFLHSKEASLFQIISRRYRKSLPLLLP